MEKNTAQLILEFLSQNPNSTVRQLSRALRVTPADIRYHLSALLKQNLVRLSSKTSNGRRGRPARSYSLSQESQPNNTLSLARAALSILLKDTADNKENTLRSLAALLFPPNITTGGPFTPKIIQLVSRLNHSGYAARWEARPNGPCIIFANCPYRQLLSQFPELCEMDRMILQNHIGAKITLDQHIHPDQSSPLTCRFSAQVSIQPQSS